VTPEQEKSTPDRPFQSIGNGGWEPRQLPLLPPRWNPPGPWAPDDEEAFMRGRTKCDRELGPRRIGL